MKTLTDLFQEKRTLRTAHRGASFSDSENTVPAFERAVKAGADLIEFDLRMSADGVPAVLHDSTIDRTSNGHGRPEEHSFSELRKLNFSYFHHGERHEAPLHPDVTIPSFEELLQRFRDTVCMNIQVYADLAGLEKICRLYLDYGMEDRGYLTIDEGLRAEYVRAFSRKIEICLTPGWTVRGTTEALERCASFGCRFVQPVKEYLKPATFSVCRELGLRPNVFFIDVPEEAAALFPEGGGGFLTNRIDLQITGCARVR